MEAFLTTLGIIGGLLILFGFYRTSIGQWTGKSFWFELDNFVGSILLVIYTVHKAAYVNIVMNAIWGIVALRGLTSISQRKPRKRRRKA
jgi:lipid-A-disaccharide synthase-like uncharacterized protein